MGCSKGRAVRWWTQAPGNKVICPHRGLHKSSHLSFYVCAIRWERVQLWGFIISTWLVKTTTVQTTIPKSNLLLKPSVSWNKGLAMAAPAINPRSTTRLGEECSPQHRKDLWERTETAKAVSLQCQSLKCWAGHQHPCFILLYSTSVLRTNFSLFFKIFNDKEGVNWKILLLIKSMNSHCGC